MTIIASVAAGIVFFLVGWLTHKGRADRLTGDAKLRHDRIIEDANRESANIIKDAGLQAKDEVYQARKEFEKSTEETRQELNRRTAYLDQRDTNLNKKITFVDHKEAKLEKLDLELKNKLVEAEEKVADIEEVKKEQMAKLEELAGLSSERAKQILIDKLISDARMAAAKSVKEIRDETERKARKESQKILSLAIQRYASEHIAESAVSVVDLPSDDMKGRIIGREGRNIRAFEMATGIDVIIDDTPEAVIISGFDPVRREVACQSLQKLIRDGRIHPGRIEEVVEKTHEEMMEKIRDIGEQACLDLDLQNINPKMHQYIGRLQYRTSYGQNLLLHSKEVASVSAIIASEIGLDPRLARRCGFLHDIGKAAEHEMDGPHAMIGAKLLRKLGENDIVINAVEGHHQDVEPESPYTFITSAADAVSASRPGARRESFDNYIKRLENLERIANSYDGVEKSYAIQAGREIRILVNHKKVNDGEAEMMAEEISRRVEGELEYPGQIKVVVMRESRAISYAK
jgi:ribonucrease Y